MPDWKAERNTKLVRLVERIPNVIEFVLCCWVIEHVDTESKNKWRREQIMSLEFLLPLALGLFGDIFLDV